MLNMSARKKIGSKRVTKNGTKNLQPRMLNVVRATSTISDVCIMPISVPIHRLSVEQAVIAYKDVLKLTPSLPMLARPVRSFDDASIAYLCQNSRSIYEDKYDGERLLCAIDHNGAATFYTRTLKPTAFPYEVKLNPGYADCVLDGERVYVDTVTGAQIPICDTGIRGNLLQCYRVFDVQYVNGQHTFAAPLHERKRLLAACVNESRNVMLAPYTVCTSLGGLREAFRLAVLAGGEGLMVKPLDAVYTPDRREHWLKLKTLHLHEYKEEYDLYAHRALKDKNGLYGVLECGYYKQESSEFVRVCKAGSGFSASIRNHIGLLVDPSTGLFKQRTIVSLSADKITDHNRSLRHPSVLAFKFDRNTVDVSRFVKPDKVL